ncbi:MAG: RNA-binding protein [Limisphaerales bacterium]
MPHPPPPEETLRSEKFQVERKVFILSLKENPRGRFLRITEDVGGRRDHVIIPATGLEDLRRLLESMIQTDQDTPMKLAEL